MAAGSSTVVSSQSKHTRWLGMSSHAPKRPPVQDRRDGPLAIYCPGDRIFIIVHLLRHQTEQTLELLIISRVP